MTAEIGSMISTPVKRQKLDGASTPLKQNEVKDSQHKLESSKNVSKKLVLQGGSSKHPLGVQPLGQQFLSQQTNIRKAGLGPFFGRLPDELLLATIGEQFSPGVVMALAQASKSCYAYCASEDNWKAWTVSKYNGDFDFKNSWRETFLTKLAKEKNDTSWKGMANVSADGLYSDLLYQPQLCRNLDFKPAWLRRETVTRVRAEDLSPEEFVKRFESTKIPVIIEGACKHWPMMNWTEESLIDLCGDKKFAVGPTHMKLKNFFEYAKTTNDDTPLFVFCKRFADRCPELADAYTTPKYFDSSRDLFTLLKDERPDWRWLLLGNARSGSKWHKDPNHTHAWNAVTKGSKRWLFLPPDCPPPGVFANGGVVAQPVSLSEWYLNHYDELDELKQQAVANQGYGLFREGTCRAGDVAFVPARCWHAVINLEDDTYAVTQNYVSESNLQTVRRFLREQVCEVSGLPKEKAKTLGDRFDTILREHRQDLVKPIETSIAKNVCQQKTEDESDDQEEGGFSFWGHLAKDERTIGFSRS